MTQTRNAAEFDPLVFVRERTFAALAIALSAALSGCGSSGASDATAGATMAPEAKVVAHDCRSADAQSSQRGCRALTVKMGSL